MATPLKPNDTRPPVTPAPVPAGPASAPSSEAAAQKLHQMLTVLWERSKATVLERVVTLRAVEQQLAAGRLDESARISALESAHKLAGVLGTFGLPRGTDLAREAEDLLQRLGDTGQIDSAHLASVLDELDQVIAARSLDR